MHSIMKQVNYKNDSLQDFFAFLRTDKQFKYSNDDAGAQAAAESTAYLDTVKVVYLSSSLIIFQGPTYCKSSRKFREKSAEALSTKTLLRWLTPAGSMSISTT